MKLSQIPDEVVDACRELGHSDEAIQKMSGEDLFSKYCQWEGLINYGPGLWKIMVALKKAEKS